MMDFVHNGLANMYFDLDVAPQKPPLTEEELAKTACFFKEDAPLIEKDDVIDKKNRYRSEVYAWLLAYKLSTNASGKQMQRIINIENADISWESSKIPRWGRLQNIFLDMVPFKAETLVFCTRCKFVVSRNTGTIPANVQCSDCNYLLTREIREKECRFVYVSIRDQIKSYLEAGKLPKLIERTACLPRAKLSQGKHAGISFSTAINITAACDAAPLTRRSKINVFPVMFFFGQIPVCYQIFFPIIASFACSKSQNLPPAATMFEPVGQELESLEKEGVKWWNGKEIVTTKVFVTICQSEAKQKCELMGMYHCNAYYGCPYCLTPGNPHKKKPTSKRTHVVFSRQVHSTRTTVPARNQEEFLGFATLAAEKLLLENKVMESTENVGVKGFPVLLGLEHFDVITSNTPDTLHVVYEGVLKKILKDELIGEVKNPDQVAPKQLNMSFASKLNIFTHFIDVLARGINSILSRFQS